MTENSEHDILLTYLKEEFRKIHTRIDSIQSIQEDQNLVFNVIKGGIGSDLHYNGTNIVSSKGFTKGSDDDDEEEAHKGVKHHILTEENDEDEENSGLNHRYQCPIYLSCCGCSTQ